MRSEERSAANGEKVVISAAKLTMAGKTKTDGKACFAEAIAASRLRCKERLIACVKALPEVVNQQDGEGMLPAADCILMAFKGARAPLSLISLLSYFLSGNSEETY